MIQVSVISMLPFIYTLLQLQEICFRQISLISLSAFSEQA